MTKAPYHISDASDITLTGDTPLIRVIEAIERSHIKIVLVVDKAGKLIGSVTDGDVRRGLLRGATPESPVKDVMHTDPYSLPVGITRQHILEMMQAMDIYEVPLVNKNGTIAGVVTREGLLGSAQIKRRNAVVIMAGGKGKRLMPLTAKIPKPMVEISGRPMLEWILHRFTNQGFNCFYLAVNHLSHIIEDYFGDGSRLSCHIEYVKEQQPLGTAGALSLLDGQFSEPFIVINGDIMASIDFGGILEYHLTSGGVATVCVRQHRTEVPYGVIEMKDGMLKTIVEKPVHENMVSAGIYVLNPEVTRLLPKDTPIDMPELLSLLVQKQQKVAVFPMREDWIDVGGHEDLERAKLTLVSSAS